MKTRLLLAATLALTVALAAPPNTRADDFPATGQTTSFRPGDDGAIQAGAPLEFEDNGDGTITDANTHLMWEKNSADGSIHDKDEFHTWDGAFDVHVATLNRTHFAGHRDWRVPNVKELQSIVNYGNSFPVLAVSPAFNTNCTAGCTVRTCSCTGFSHAYWSSTTDATPPPWRGSCFSAMVPRAPSTRTSTWKQVTSAAASSARCGAA